MTAATNHMRFHPDHWLAGGRKASNGRMEYCDACDLCAAVEQKLPQHYDEAGK